ncbi:MAG: hypothetical protein ABL998_14725 [Planctomycetota bacterium]
MRPRLLATFAAFFLVSSATAQLAPRYTLTRVNPLGADGIGGVIGLTDSGFVAASALPGSSLSGFAWTVGGHGSSSAALTFPPPAGVSWVDSAGLAINASGVAVGQFDTVPFAFPLSRGFRFQGGVTTELFGPEGTPGLPTAINRDGWIVGSTVSTSGTRAVLWSPSLVASYLDPLVLARDINDAGAVLGSLGAGSAERAAILAGGVLTELGDLDPLADPLVQAAALNNLGHAVGRTRLGGRDVAFRWTPTSGMTQLTPFASPLASPDSAFDINDAGWVIGIANDAGSAKPVLWSPDGALADLSARYTPFFPLELHFLAGYRINSAGQIAASANVHFQTAWALLTPAELEAVALAPAVTGSLYTVDVTGALPGRTVFLVGDVHDPSERGYRALPGGPLGVSMPTPRFAARATADAAGHAHLVWNVPSSAAGLSLRLQAFHVAPTRVSNLLRETP